MDGLPQLSWFCRLGLSCGEGSGPGAESPGWVRILRWCGCFFNV